MLDDNSAKDVVLRKDRELALCGADEYLRDQSGRK
jgi:hypothetical protein